MSGRIILAVSGKGDFPGDGPLPTFWSWMVGLRTGAIGCFKVAIVKEMTGRNRAAQLEIVNQVSRQ